MAEAEQRVCPRCGNPANHDAFCSECGLDLSAQTELPTHRQWIEERRAPAGESAPPAAPPDRGPAAAGAKARSPLLRPLPLIIGAGLLVVVAVVVILVAGGGGGGNEETVAQRLETVLKRSPYGVKSPTVECPSDVGFEAGATVECTASAADGTSATVAAEVKSTSGEGEVSIENLIPTQTIANTCSTEMTELVETAGIATGSCEVKCPELAEASPNGALTCHYTLEEGERQGTVVIPLGPDGKTTEGGWEATEE